MVTHPAPGDTWTTYAARTAFNGKSAIQVREATAAQHAEWKRSREQAITDGEIDLDASNNPDEWNVYLTGVSERTKFGAKTNIRLKKSRCSNFNVYGAPPNSKQAAYTSRQHLSISSSRPPRTHACRRFRQAQSSPATWYRPTRHLRTDTGLLAPDGPRTAWDATLAASGICSPWIGK